MQFQVNEVPYEYHPLTWTYSHTDPKRTIRFIHSPQGTTTQPSHLHFHDSQDNSFQITFSNASLEENLPDFSFVSHLFYQLFPDLTHPHTMLPSETITISSASLTTVTLFLFRIYGSKIYSISYKDSNQMLFAVLFIQLQNNDALAVVLDVKLTSFLKLFDRWATVQNCSRSPKINFRFLTLQTPVTIPELPPPPPDGSDPSEEKLQSQKGK